MQDAKGATDKPFKGKGRVVTATGEEGNVETQTCRVCLTVESPWRSVRFTIPFMVFLGPGNLEIIGQQT